MSDDIVYAIEKGSDDSFVIEWLDRDENGVVSPKDLTDTTASIFDAHALIDGHITATVDPVNPQLGRILCAFTWQDDMPAQGAKMSFRVRVTFPDGRKTTPEIWILVK